METLTNDLTNETLNQDDTKLHGMGIGNAPQIIDTNKVEQEKPKHEEIEKTYNEDVDIEYSIQEWERQLEKELEQLEYWKKEYNMYNNKKPTGIYHKGDTPQDRANKAESKMKELEESTRKLYNKIGNAKNTIDYRSDEEKREDKLRDKENKRLDELQEKKEKREDNAYQRSVDDMRKAGLNPALMFGNGSASGSSGGMSAGTGSGNKTGQSQRDKEERERKKRLKQEQDKINNALIGMLLSSITKIL